MEIRLKRYCPIATMLKYNFSFFPTHLTSALTNSTKREGKLMSLLLATKKCPSKISFHSQPYGSIHDAWHRISCDRIYSENKKVRNGFLLYRNRRLTLENWKASEEKVCDPLALIALMEHAVFLIDKF